MTTPSSCEEIQANAAGLASLGAEDPERVSAFAHASTCPRCRAALAEGQQLMRLLDEEALAFERPAPAVMSKVSAEILAALGNPQGQESKRRREGGRGLGARPSRVSIAPVALLFGVWLASGVLRLAAATRPPPPESGRAATTSLAMVALTATGAALAVMVRIGLVSLSLFPAASLLMSFIDGGQAARQASIGVSCAGFELGFAFIPAAIAGLFVRRGSLPRAAASLAIAAAGGSLVAQSVLHSLCHARPSTAHNLLFHTAPVCLALLLGAMVGKRMARPQA